MSCDCCKNNEEPRIFDCPECADQVSFVSGVDRECRERRLSAINKSVLTNYNGKVRFSDGSEDRPIFLDVQEIDSGSGGIIIQSTGGRIRKLVPPDDQTSGEYDVYELVAEGNNLMWKLKGESSPVFRDSDISANSAVQLAGFGCASRGKTSLVALNPGCSGNRYLKINQEGLVTCADDEIDTCMAKEETETLSMLAGCHDGKWKGIKAQAGMTIIGSDSEDSQWQLVEAVGSSLFIPRHTIWERSVSNNFNSGTEPHSQTIDITSLPQYNAAFNGAILNFSWFGNTSSSRATVKMIVNGNEYLRCRWDTGFQVETNNNTALVEIPDNKVWSFQITRDSFQPASQSGYHYVKLEIDGWIR